MHHYARRDHQRDRQRGPSAGSRLDPHHPRSCGTSSRADRRSPRQRRRPQSRGRLVRRVGARMSFPAGSGAMGKVRAQSTAHLSGPRRGPADSRCIGPHVAGETCSTCGTARTGSFRYCLSCGFDYEPRPTDAVVPRWPVWRSRSSASVAPAESEETIGVADDMACPFLGLVDDPDTHFMFATAGHRCRAERDPAGISMPHQGRYCLTDEHRACPIYPTTDRVDARAPGTSAPASNAYVWRPGLRRRSLTPLVVAALLVVAAVWVIGNQAQDSRAVDRTPVATTPSGATQPPSRPSSPPAS
jgi:hypothetical protein